MRGRKPKPTALKALAGNPGRRPLNEDEPRPPAETPPKPAHLGPRAAELWDEWAPQLVALSVIGRIDGPALAIVCQLWERVELAEAKVNEKGLLVTGQTGAPIANPYIAIANAAYDRLKIYLPELGMTPSARSRLKVAAKKTDKPAGSKLALFLNRGKAAS